KASLLLVGFGRRCWNDRGNVRLGPGSRGHAATSLRSAAQGFRGWLWLVDLGVVGAERRARPARLRDQIFQQENVITQVRRVPQLVREGLVAGDEIHV